MRVVYAVVAGLALVCPFWSMLGFLECRRRMNRFMKLFNTEFYRIMTEHNETSIFKAMKHAKTMEDRARHATTGLPHKNWLYVLFDRLQPAIQSCRRRARGFSGLAPLAEPDCPHSPDGELPSAATKRDTIKDTETLQRCLRVHDDYLEWWTLWCEKLHRFSRTCLHFGIFFNVLCAAVLLGLYFNSAYPDTPEVWKAYCMVIFLGLAIAGVGHALLWYSGPDVRLEYHYMKKKGSWCQDSTSKLAVWYHWTGACMRVLCPRRPGQQHFDDFVRVRPADEDEIFRRQSRRHPALPEWTVECLLQSPSERNLARGSPSTPVLQAGRPFHG
mmetsp:Transcript_35160/g.76789  ORF Transcript_35160/g.76789 Transcript_35160/m.76789 type:complete len:329 (-) Transcript_35160:53-1039(-)